MKIRVCLAAVMALFVAQAAQASMVLVLDDLSSGPLDVIVIDGAVAGTVSDDGFVSTHSDADGLANGVITHIGGVGVFGVNVTTGISKPVIGPARIDLNSVNVTTTGAGSLLIGLTDTGFVNTGGMSGVSNKIGGTTDGTVSVAFGGDPGNGEFLVGAIGTNGPFGSGAFSGTVNIPQFLGGLFSLSQAVTIKHTGAAQSTSFNSLVETLPEPATLAIWSVLGLAGVAYRRRRAA